MRIINCAHLIEAPDRPVAVNRQIRLSGGQVEMVAAIAPAEADALFVMPALVNAHDHGRAVRTSSLGAAGKPLETWLQYQALIPSLDPYLVAVVALSRAALGGVGTVMMHLTRPQGLTDLPTEAAAIARAARDVGVRVGFAVSMRDRNPLVYGPSEPILAALPPQARREIENIVRRPVRQPQEFIALFDEVAAAAAGPMFGVQFGPNGVQWCSDALLAAIAGSRSAAAAASICIFWRRVISATGPMRLIPMAWSSISMRSAFCPLASRWRIAFGRALMNLNCWRRAVSPSP
jgi:cytosine/adenosine deaminase-related metal-dependent hydrolase